MTPTPKPDWCEVPADFWTRLDSPRWATNAARARDLGFDSCTVCGRGIAPDSGFTLEIIGGGGAILRADLTADTEDSGYMGVWDVGPECGKKVPAAYRTPRTDGASPKTSLTAYQGRNTR